VARYVATRDLDLPMLSAVHDPEAVDAPVVTALMPLKTYHLQYLSEALGSLTGQTCPQWQLLVIADPPDVQELARVLAPWLNDDRIELIANEGRRMAGAINTGMRHATTDFVAILLADDAWSPDAVAVLTRRIREVPHIDFFHSARRIVDDDGRPISSVHRPSPTVSLADFFERAPVKHLLCWRRAMGLAIGGLDERLSEIGPDDLDFPWTMAEHGALFEAIDDCLYIYRDHRRIARLTTHIPRRVAARELRRVYRKHGITRRQARARIEAARRTYLQQCLFQTRLDAQIRTRLGRIPAAWRDTYR
jgi:glycosyltransferase involved in cell wall biosynthesis